MSKILRLIFGCHARPDRSFYWKGHQFPICARCTGELVGILVEIPFVILKGPVYFPLCILLMLPLVFDGFRQLLTNYTSTNFLRFITGFFFGIAFVSMLVYFHNTCVWIAGQIVEAILGETEAVNAAVKRFYFLGIV